MAKPTSKSGTRVTRITAGASQTETRHAPSEISQKQSTAKATESERPARARRRAPRALRSNPITHFGRYMKGAWYELRQVRWPDRRATWGMTGALIGFTAFFVVVILLLDAGFSELFKLIMGK